MAVHTIRAVQKIPVSLDKAWDFFCTPLNLQSITPENMSFKILSPPHGDTMYAGQIIEYKVKPFLGISMYWMTEITHIEENKFFVDEQRKGPYRMWHHQHHFKAIEGGTEMTDIVHYENPFWFFGELANTIFVRNKLRDIFSYRFKKVEELFGSFPNSVINLQIS